MKKTVKQPLRFALILSLLATAAHAQSDTGKPGEMRLKVTERSGGNIREIERTYRADGMTDARRDAIVNKLIDSLRNTRKGKDSQISVTVEGKYDQQGKGGPSGRVGVQDDRISLRNRNGMNRTEVETIETVPGDNKTGRRVEGYSYSTPRPPRPPRAPRPLRGNVWMSGDSVVIEDSSMAPFDTLGRQMRRFRLDRRKMDSLASNMRRFQYNFRRDFQPMVDQLNRGDWAADLGDQLSRPFDAWSRNGTNQASTVRGLDVYPSNPDRNMLNVRFNAPAKGDVSIMVTNPKGKEVAHRELKDFSGEFVGQVDLGRKAEGVYFVTVTQNDDGAVRRVVIRKDEAQK
jgi:Secretion system C-terminal sorting domain